RTQSRVCVQPGPTRYDRVPRRHRPDDTAARPADFRKPDRQYGDRPESHDVYAARGARAVAELARVQPGRPSAGSRAGQRAWGRVVVGGLCDRKMKSPSALAMSFDIQRAFGSSTVVQTGYLGTRGYNFSMARQYNEVDRLTGLRRNPNLSQGIYWDSSQRTTFHSWQTSLYQRLTRDFSANVNYTWGSAMAHTGGDISPGFIGDTTANVQDFFNIDAEWGPASGDVRHNFLANATYTIAPERF